MSLLSVYRIAHLYIFFLQDPNSCFSTTRIKIDISASQQTERKLADYVERPTLDHRFATNKVWFHDPLIASNALYAMIRSLNWLKRTAIIKQLGFTCKILYRIRSNAWQSKHVTMYSIINCARICLCLYIDISYRIVQYVWRLSWWRRLSKMIAH